MKVLIFDGDGMLGHKLVQLFGAPFETWTPIGTSFSEVEHFGIFDRNRTLEHLDVTDQSALTRTIETIQPDVVINALRVINRLPISKDVVNTLLVNSIFPHQLAGLSAEFGFRLILISTDCVFDGKKGNYTEQDDANALDLYGRSKNLVEVSGANC